MGRAQWRKGRHTRARMERIGRGPSQHRPCFRPYPEFRWRGCRRQAAERARRMAARSHRQVQSRSATNPGPPARALRRQALVLAGSLSEQGFSRTCGSIPTSLRRRAWISRPPPPRKGFWSMASRSGLRTCRNSISVSLAASQSRGPAGARGGAGFADLEQGVFRELGLVSASTPIATTVHSSQVVADSDVVMESHDLALHFIATELELIATRTSSPSAERRRLGQGSPGSVRRYSIFERAARHDRAQEAAVTDGPIIPDGLPIIDLGSSGEGDGVSLTRIVADVGAACRDVGFFYVVNHGVDTELIAKAFAQSHDFFALPVADKRELAIETIGGNRGYSGLLHEALDPARGPDMKEAFNIGLDLAADDPELLAGEPFRSLNAWPERAGLPRNGCSPTTTPAQRSARDCIVLSRATLASSPISSMTNSIGRWRRCGSALSGVEGRWTAPDRRGRAYRLWQPHAARDRRCRRP